MANSVVIKIKRQDADGKAYWDEFKVPTSRAGT